MTLSTSQHYHHDHRHPSNLSCCITIISCVVCRSMRQHSGRASKITPYGKILPTSCIMNMCRLVPVASVVWAEDQQGTSYYCPPCTSG